MKLAVICRRLGPYHRARLEAAGRLGELWCIEGSGADSVYAWDHVEVGALFQRLTLFPSADSGQLRPWEVRKAVANALDRVSPNVVAIPGWEDSLALAGLLWGIKAGRPVVVMSESNEFDAPRSALKEWAKGRILGLCSAGLVGGTAAANYLEKLGMNRAQVFTGCDVVDNGYFARKASEARSAKCEVRGRYALPERFFLASARFVEKKNLSRLLGAFARYRQRATATLPADTPPTAPWDLVLLGDGPLRGELETRISQLGIRDSVRLPGFKQYGELPAYYALASAFVHASTVEQWGLVVNEAMASGLPVLVSKRCGCAPDLVQEGRNGFTFDPLDVGQLAGLMLRVSGLNFPLSAFGTASRDIIRRWSPEVFAESLRKAVEVARSTPRPKPSLVDTFLLWSLLHLR